ncbi:condensation domain-containing protein, partial [Paraburkholderia sp. SIMBA_027]
GWSFTLLFNELIQLYLDNETISPEVKLQYKDYAEWQNKLIHNGKLNKSKMFWMEKLGGTIPVSTIPTDFSRSGFKTYDGNSILFDVNN